MSARAWFWSLLIAALFWSGVILVVAYFVR